METDDLKVQAEPQAVPEGATADAAEPGQPEGAEAEASVPEGEAEAADGVAEELRELLTEDGKGFDIGKVKNLKKSHDEAQKRVGRTAKERERLKSLEQAEPKIRAFDQFDALVRADPELQDTLHRAVARSRGVPVEHRGAARPEDLRKEVTELMKAGHVDVAVEKRIRSRPAYHESHETKQRLEAQAAAQEKARQDAENDRELAAARAKWGPSADEEVMEKFRECIPQTASYDAAFKLAFFELGRTPSGTKKPATEAAVKAAATGVPQGAKGALRKVQSNEVFFGIGKDRWDKLLERV